MPHPHPHVHGVSFGFVFALALLICLLLPGAAPAQSGSIGTEIYQCRNRLAGTGGNINNCTGAAWVHGNAGHANSLYREGDFVPMRSIISDLQSGHTYTLRLGYDAVQSGLHAYDYLGSVDASAHPGQVIAPCINAPPTAGDHACGNAPSLWQVPIDTHTHFPAGSSQEEGHFSAWGGTLTGAAYFYCTPETSASHPCGPIGLSGQASYVPREIDVTFRAAGDTVVLGWGAHIASSLDWGAGRTFISAGSGSSFHMRLKQIQPEGGPAQSTGGQELSLSASALAPQPGLTTQVAPAAATTDQNVVDVAALLTAAGSRPVTGSVQFFVCFSATAAPACSVNGTSIGHRNVVAASGANGTASMTFSADQVPGGEGPGHYCFRVEFTPSSAFYSPTKHTDTATECFVAAEETADPPLLTVTKICDPPDAGLFDFFVDNQPFGAPDVACGQSRGPTVVEPGTRTVSETAGSGTDLANYITTFGEDCTQTAPGSRSGTVTLAPGQSKVCVITNARLAAPKAFLSLHKVCDPPGGSGEFQILLNDVVVAVLGCGDMSAEPLELEPNVTYTVREAGGDDTSAADYTSTFSGDCAGGTVTLQPNQNGVCAITNTRIPPTTTLEVQKVCDPVGDKGRFKLTIHTSDGRLVKSVKVVCPGTTHAFPVEPGDYTVGEAGVKGTDLGKYDVVIGGDCESDGTITIAAGEDAQCLITNVRKPAPPEAELTVTKLCVPADDGGRFLLSIDGQASRDVVCGHSLGPVVLSPGGYHVSESAGTGTNLSDYTTSIGGDCAADGSITLAKGEQQTCVITNVRRGLATGTVEIQKQCSPAGLHDRFQLELDQEVFRGIGCGQSTGTVVIALGDHRIGEVAVNGTTSRFTTTIGGGCSPSGAFTVSAGQHVVCVVTNTRVTVEPPLKPPPACYMLSVKPQRATAGRPVRVVARVHIDGTPVRGIRVYLTGAGLSTFGTTGRDGRVVFLVTPLRSGILRVLIRREFLCPKQPPHAIRVGGAAFTG